MDDPAVPDERPPYLDRCREMDFRGLREFIDHHLKQLSESGTGDEGPRSKAEFDTLYEMLRAHLDAMRQDAPEPAGPRPTNDVPYVSWWFEPSEALDSAYNRRDGLLEYLDEARYDPSKRRYIEELESQLKPLEREISEREAKEKQEYEKRCHDADEAREEYYLRLQLWQEKAKREQKYQEQLAFRDRIVRRVRRDIDRAFKPGAAEPTGRIQWKPLPKDQATNDHVRRYYKGLRNQGRLDAYDQERLDKVLSLPREGWRVPTDAYGGFDAYSIFTFAHTKKALLECPIYGNAAYVVDSDDQRWLKMKKQQLIESGQAKRIVHRGDDWFEKVKEALEIPPMSEAS